MGAPIVWQLFYRPAMASFSVNWPNGYSKLTVCADPIKAKVLERIPYNERSYRTTLYELRKMKLISTIRASGPNRRAEYALNVEQVNAACTRTSKTGQRPIDVNRSMQHVPVKPPLYIGQSKDQSERESQETSSSPNVFDDDLDIHQQFPRMLRMLGEQAGIKNPWTAKHQKWAEELVHAYQEGTQLSADVELAIREASSRLMQHGGESWEYMLQTTETVMAQMAADALPTSRESYY